jgi:hypothetical protein
MTEVPPGSTATFAATGALSAIDYSNTLDQFVILSTHAGGTRSYLTNYNTIGSQMDNILLVDTRQQDQSTVSLDSTPVPGTLSSVMSVDVSTAGVCYIIRNTTAAATNQMYGFPIGAHWTKAAITLNRLITPSMSTQGCTAFYRCYVNAMTSAGANELSLPAEAFRVYYRTAGINDNSGSWVLIDQSGNISGVGAANAIQFMIEFRTVGVSCIPARIFSVSVLYEDSDSIPSTLEWNYTDSNNGTGTVGFSQITAFPSSVPVFTIEYRRSDTGVLVLTQASSGTTNGNFQYWDGSAWTNGTGTNTVGLRRRFVPGVGILPVGVDLYMKIITS